jgi:hypothetical protein
MKTHNVEATSGAREGLGLHKAISPVCDLSGSFLETYLQGLLILDLTQDNLVGKAFYIGCVSKKVSIICTLSCLG